MKVTGNKWDDLLAEEWQKPYYRELREFLNGSGQNYRLTVLYFRGFK